MSKGFLNEKNQVFSLHRNILINEKKIINVRLNEVQEEIIRKISRVSDWNNCDVDQNNVISLAMREAGWHTSLCSCREVSVRVTANNYAIDALLQPMCTSKNAQNKDNRCCERPVASSAKCTRVILSWTLIIIEKQRVAQQWTPYMCFYSHRQAYRNETHYLTPMQFVGVSSSNKPM